MEGWREAGRQGGREGMVREPEPLKDYHHPAATLRLRAMSTHQRWQQSSDHIQTNWIDFCFFFCPLTSPGACRNRAFSSELFLVYEICRLSYHLINDQ